MQKKIKSTKFVGWVTISLGGLSLTTSIIYGSQILAFIGLGLTFWGIILTYVKSEEYVKESLLEATCLPPLETLNRFLETLGYKEKAIYLPPKSLKDPESHKALIPKNKSLKGIIITPPGAELTKLFEKTLETSFTKVDLQHLQINLPKLLIEELEIAQNLEINIENNKAFIKIVDTPYYKIAKENTKFQQIYESMGCPLASALACAFAKATGKPITIEKQEINEKTKSIEIEYRIIQEEKT